MIVPPGRFRVSARSSAAGNQHDLSQDDEMKQTIDEIRRLRGCINDLISVQALPAMWTGQEPAQIVSTLLDVLIGMLRLDFAYARLKDPAGESPIEMLRLPQSRNLTASPQTIGHVLHPWLEDAPQKWPVLVRNPIEDGDVSIMPLRLGLRDKIGVIVAGSQRADFPGETERLLLSVAANQAAIGLQEARLLSEQKRVAEELDQRVAERTSELLAANEQLEKEIAERMQAEQKLRRSEAYLAEAQRLTHTGSFARNVAAGKLTESSEQHSLTHSSDEHSRLYGFDPERGIPSSEEFRQRIHPEDRDGALEKFERAVAERTDVEVDFRTVLPDGTIKNLHAISHPVVNTAGDLVEYVGTVMDVTDRKQAEETLRRSEAYLAEAQRLTHTGSWALNVATGEPTHSSEEHLRLLGFDPEKDKPSEVEFRQRVHPDDRESVVETMDKAIGGRTDFEADFRVLLPDGTIKYLHAIGHPVINAAGDLVEYMGTSWDVTERKRTEEALLKAQSELAHVTRVATLGEMTASISHEINQPLGAMVNNANACLRWLAASKLEEARQSAMLIAADGYRAGEIIARIRALAQKAPPRKDWLNINKTIQEVITLTRSEVQGNHVSLKTRLGRNVPPILGDRIQLQQVLLNLIMNAIEAMRGVDEYLPRELWVDSEEVESTNVLIAVRDSGPGLDAETLDRLFETFYTTKPEGLGMGLPISRSIIEAHGGRLWATANASHTGAVFQFTLPISERAS